MKTFLKVLLIVVITLIVFVTSIFAYVMIKDPFGVGGIIKASVFKQGVEENLEKYKDYDHPLLTEEQETTAIEAGIDLEQIPTEVTPEQLQCGVGKLGQDRVNEIMAGSEPSPLEVMKLLPCAN